MDSYIHLNLPPGSSSILWCGPFCITLKCNSIYGLPPNFFIFDSRENSQQPVLYTENPNSEIDIAKKLLEELGKQLVQKPVQQPFEESVSSFEEPLEQPVLQPIKQHFRQPIKQPVEQPFRQMIRNYVKQTDYQPNKQYIEQSGNQYDDLSDDQSVKYSRKRLYGYDKSSYENIKDKLISHILDKIDKHSIEIFNQIEKIKNKKPYEYITDLLINIDLYDINDLNDSEIDIFSVIYNTDRFRSRINRYVFRKFDDHDKLFIRFHNHSFLTSKFILKFVEREERHTIL